MAKLREMRSEAGDFVLTEYDLDDTLEAEKIFNERMYGVPVLPLGKCLPKNRMLAFVNKGDGDQEMINRFSPYAEDIVLMPIVVGG